VVPGRIPRPCRARADPHLDTWANRRARTCWGRSRRDKVERPKDRSRSPGPGRTSSKGSRIGADSGAAAAWASPLASDVRNRGVSTSSSWSRRRPRSLPSAPESWRPVFSNRNPSAPSFPGAVLRTARAFSGTYSRARPCAPPGSSSVLARSLCPSPGIRVAQVA